MARYRRRNEVLWWIAGLAFMVALVLGMALWGMARRSMDPLPPSTLRHLSMYPHLVSHNGFDDTTIFVNVAAYRDEYCAATLTEIFALSRAPERIFVGATVQRYAPERTYECVPWKMWNRTCQEQTFCPTDNIRVRHLAPEEARGPTMGRYVSQLMYRGESWLLLIDSHTRFADIFDARMIANALMMPTLGVLSHYPSSYNDKSMALNRLGPMMAMCTVSYIDLQVLKNGARWVDSTYFPREHVSTAAGFMFSDAWSAIEVPFDPMLDFIFDGEESLYTMRLFTHGWDAYLPGENVVFHHYERHHVPRYWALRGSQWGKNLPLSMKRLHAFVGTTINQTTHPLVPRATAECLNLTKGENVYGMGRVRPLAEFYARSHCDPIHRKCSDEACAKLYQRTKVPPQRRIVGW